MNTVIEQLQWSLDSSDREIDRLQKDVQRQAEYVVYAQEHLNEAMNRYTHAIKLKRETTKALEILRAAQ